MWFKSLMLFRFTEPCTLDPDTLAEALARAAFRPCGSQDLVTRGWVPPLGGEDGALVHAAGGFWLVCLQSEDKLLPASVIRAALDERVAEIEDREARKVRRKEKETLRDEVLLDLLPRAFTRRKRLYAYLDPRGGWLVVNGTPGKAVDDFTSLLRKAAGSLLIAPLRTALGAAFAAHAAARAAKRRDDGVIEGEFTIVDAPPEGPVEPLEPLPPPEADKRP